MSERRTHDRVFGGLPGVQLRDGDDRSDGILRDISANGAFIYGAVGFPQGRACAFEIEVEPGETPVVLSAVVVRREPMGCALEFQALPSPVLARLQQRMKAA